VLVIEHNLDVIKTADWIIDMGPEGGSRGGMVVAEGTPEAVAADPESFTGQFLKPLLDGREAVQPKRRASAKTATKTATKPVKGRTATKATKATKPSKSTNTAKASKAPARATTKRRRSA
jgi:excinuclease ABC subunit A